MRNLTRDMTRQEREEFEERAAIMQFDGGLTRQGAEWQAWRDIIRKREERRDA